MINNEDYFNFFKFCLNKDNQIINYDEAKSLAKTSNLTLKQAIEITVKSNTVKQFNEIKNNNEKKYSDLLYEYKQILEKTTTLAKELKLTNSLEYSFLYTYLLYSGHFSKDKKLLFKTEGRKQIDGFYALDIMNGKGVCLNFSDMLKDFLNHSGFNSATILSSSIYKNDILSKLSIRKGRIHHASTLIQENGNLYIYDTTNLLLLKLKNKDIANVIISNIKKFKYTHIYNYKLYPYNSYNCNLTPKSIAVLDIINMISDFDTPYNKQSYIETHDKFITNLKKNKDIIPDYYNNTKKHIDIISNKLSLIKTL